MNTYQPGHVDTKLNAYASDMGNNRLRSPLFSVILLANWGFPLTFAEIFRYLKPKEEDVFVVKTLINWIISTLILWVLSLLPFMALGFAGLVPFLLAAVVIGLINALIVPIVKGIFKKAKGILLIIISLLINAAALWLGGFLVPGFYIVFFPTAIIAAIVLSLLNAGFNRD